MNKEQLEEALKTLLFVLDTQDTIFKAINKQVEELGWLGSDTSVND